MDMVPKVFGEVPVCAWEKTFEHMHREGADKRKRMSFWKKYPYQLKNNAGLSKEGVRKTHVAFRRLRDEFHDGGFICGLWNSLEQGICKSKDGRA